MRKQRIVFSIIITLIVFSSFSYQKSASVTDWVEQTLLLSTALNFTNNESYSSPVRLRYTHNGWEALSNFLSHYANSSLGNDMPFHPTVISEPAIVNSGIITNSHFFAGTPYWRVEQGIAIPELNINIAFSVLVIETTDKHFLIQSLDMVAQ